MPLFQYFINNACFVSKPIFYIYNRHRSHKQMFMWENKINSVSVNYLNLECINPHFWATVNFESKKLSNYDVMESILKYLPLKEIWHSTISRSMSEEISKFISILLKCLFQIYLFVLSWNSWQKHHHYPSLVIFLN